VGSRWLRRREKVSRKSILRGLSRYDTRRRLSSRWRVIRGRFRLVFSETPVVVVTRSNQINKLFFRLFEMAWSTLRALGFHAIFTDGLNFKKTPHGPHTARKMLTYYVNSVLSTSGAISLTRSTQARMDLKDKTSILLH
jgi:hypothetical protein